MDIIEWDESYSIDFNLIDLHHRHLFDMLNISHTAFKTDCPIEELEGLVIELVNYAQYHFDTEEMFMANNHYIFIKEHIAEHDAFRAIVLKFKDDYIRREAVLSIEIFLFLSDWVKNHIESTDIKLKGFFDVNI